MSEYFGAPNDFRQYSTHNDLNHSVPTIVGISGQQRDNVLRRARSVLQKYRTAATNIANHQRQIDSKRQIADAVYRLIDKYSYSRITGDNNKIMAESEYNYLDNFVNTTQVMLRRIGQWTD